MTITVHSIKAAVFRLEAAMQGLEQQLNEVDSKLGDGDTGGMLARVLHKMTEVDFSGAIDPGAALLQLAKAATLATGSSLGTLIATGLLTAGREARGRESLEAADLSPLVAKARDAMMVRGGAKLGDKTVLDSLDAIAVALEGADTESRAVALASEAADRALSDFRQKASRIGRARMFGERTIGIDDPGMIAAAELIRALL